MNNKDPKILFKIFPIFYLRFAMLAFESNSTYLPDHWHLVYAEKCIWFKQSVSFHLIYVAIEFSFFHWNMFIINFSIRNSFLSYERALQSLDWYYIWSECRTFRNFIWQIFHSATHQSENSSFSKNTIRQLTKGKKLFGNWII